MKKILLIILFLSHILAYAQIITSNTYTMNDGLPSNMVRNITQDSCGFMWFGTNNGLSRFDGLRFKNYYFSEIIHESVSNAVQTLLLDSKNKLWIGLDNGVVVYDIDNDSFELFNLKTKDEEHLYTSIACIIEDIDGEYWIGTNGKGVFRYSPQNDNKLVLYSAESNNLNALSNNSIRTLMFDKKHNLWIGYQNSGLTCFEKHSNTFSHYKNDGSLNCLSDNSIQHIFEDSSGNIWIATFNNGLDLFNNTSKTFQNFKDNQKTNLLYRIHSISEVSTNELLITSDNGTCVFNIDKKEVQPSNKLGSGILTNCDKYIYSVFIDREKSIWYGSYFDGIKMYSSFLNNFKYFSCANNPKDTQLGRVVNTIYEDNNNKIWIGTDDNGIFNYDCNTKQLTPFKTASDLDLNYYCIHGLVVYNNRLYAGTYGRGLEMYDIETKKFKSYLPVASDSISANPHRIFSLFKSKDGLIYIGESRGASFFNPKTETFQAINFNLGPVVTINEDNNGLIWLGTGANGLYSYNPKTGNLKTYLHSESKNSIPKNAISTIVVDHRNQMWIGTYGHGFCKYNPETDSFIRYDKVKLPNKIITSIIPSGDILWIATYKGIVRFNSQTNEQKIYSKANGLYNEQFTLNSGICTSNGQIMLGAVNGFCQFSPLHLRENTISPSVVITNIKINGNEISPNDENAIIQTSVSNIKNIDIKYNESLSIDFATLSYVSPKQNRYRYTLNGSDKNWHEISGDHNNISYQSLQPGNYCLKIKGTNDDTMWNDNETLLNIRVIPHFARSIYAYIIYIFIIITIIFLSVRFYIKHTEKKNSEKMAILNYEKEKELYHSKIEFFTNIAHEIRTPLSLIIGPLEHLMNTSKINEYYGDYLYMIEQNYKRLYALVNQLLDFRKVDSNLFEINYNSYNLYSIIKDIVKIFSLASVEKSVKIDLSGIDSELNIVTDYEALTKIISNILSNAIKYSRTKISILVENTENETIISIIDDGPGIPDNEKNKIFDAFYQVKSSSNIHKKGVGIGLQITRLLVELMNGKIYVKDRDDNQQGTVMSVSLPKSHIDMKQQESSIRIDEMIDDNNENEDYDSSSDNKRKTYSIMVVDDNSEVLVFLSKILSEEYFVIAASNAEKAIEILANNKPDVIISDVVMGNMDGIELCSKIKSDIATSHIPVILLTAKTDLNSKIKGLESGADAYIEKPFSPIYLRAQINNLLKSRESLLKNYTDSPLVELQTTIHNKVDEEFMNKCHAIIIENLSNSEFSVNMLADELNMSRSVMFTKIKQVIGMTPNDFIKLIRLKQACKLISEGQYRVTEVGYIVGFNSSSYFARCFQQQFGMLPNDFLKKNKTTQVADPISYLNKLT